MLGLKSVASFILVVGLIYRFTKTCINVYNSTSPTKALIAKAKRLVIDCTPPTIKYPLLCAGALACRALAL